MSSLFEMGGYEFYVWGSVGLGLAVFAWNVIAPEIQRRSLFEQLVEQLADGDGEDAGETS